VTDSVETLETRNPKFETNPNDQKTTKSQTSSDFELRISDFYPLAQ
jgi:hypothetical protein